jgi:hypothetical protein
MIHRPAIRSSRLWNNEEGLPKGLPEEGLPEEGLPEEVNESMMASLKR